MTPQPPWQMYSRTELDRQYSPSSRVASLDAYLQEYASLSTVARAVSDPQLGLSFGPAPWEHLDYFCGPAPDAPLLLFVHGGNWQALTRTESAFAAPTAHDAGAAYVTIDYGLAPQVTLEDMITSVRRSISWLAEHADDLGFCAGRIHVAGSSAGAHLVAAAVLTSPAYCRAVQGCVLLSGIYDLEPVRNTYINEALALTAARASALSPVHHLQPSMPAVVLARGRNETDEYARQHLDMRLALLSRAPRMADLTVEGRNHFDLPYDLAVAGTALGDAVLAQIDGN